jgi:hypothetical protein
MSGPAGPSTSGRCERHVRGLAAINRPAGLDAHAGQPRVLALIDGVTDGGAIDGVPGSGVDTSCSEIAVVGLP